MPEKILIVCYSYTGNTLRIAEEIRQQTGGTLCELYPRQPYPMLFDKLLEQVRKEVRTGYLPGLLPIGAITKDYDTLFVGTPNWCSTIAPPMVSFLQKNNIDGKRLLPFYSHCGGGKGNVEQDLKRLCPKAEILPGLSLINDGGIQLKKKVEMWLKQVTPGL